MTAHSNSHIMPRTPHVVMWKAKKSTAPSGAVYKIPDIDHPPVGDLWDDQRDGRWL